MVCGTLLIFLAVAGAAYLWIQSVRIPPGVLEPGKMKVFFAVVNFTKKLDAVLHSFTGKEFVISNALVSRAPPLPSTVTKEEKYIEGVRTVIYRGAGEAKDHSPGIVYYHGGAWVMGNPELEELLSVDLVHDLGVVIVSVDYRLAPQHPFPAPFDDCYKVTEYVLAHPKEFKIDPNKIMIGGQSAGGNLAAAVGTKLRDEGLAKKIRGQLLIVPVTQGHDFETKSYIEYKNDWLLTQEFMVDGWAKYALGHNYRDAVQSMKDNTHVPQEKKNEFNKLCDNSPLLSVIVPKPTDNDLWERLQPYLENPYMAPLVAKDVSGIAPTILVTAGQDVLRDEGLIYGERLKKSGVKVVSVHSDNVYHGILINKNIVPLDYNRNYQAVLPHLKELLD